MGPLAIVKLGLVIFNGFHADVTVGEALVGHMFLGLIAGHVTNFQEGSAQFGLGSTKRVAKVFIVGATCFEE